MSDSKMNSRKIRSVKPRKRIYKRRHRRQLRAKQKNYQSVYVIVSDKKLVPFSHRTPLKRVSPITDYNDLLNSTTHSTRSNDWDLSESYYQNEAQRRRRAGYIHMCYCRCSPICIICCVFASLLLAIAIAAIILAMLLKSPPTTTTTTTTSTSTTTTTTSTTTTSTTTTTTTSTTTTSTTTTTTTSTTTTSTTTTSTTTTSTTTTKTTTTTTKTTTTTTTTDYIQRTATVTEDMPISISCAAPQTKINIVSVFYGVSNVAICNCAISSCTTMDVTTKIVSYCHAAGNPCTFPVDNIFFVDTCYGIVKTCIVKYYCS